MTPAGSMAAGSPAREPAASQAIDAEARRERLLSILAGATFLIFFQAYMVAPLIPRLSAVFVMAALGLGFGGALLLFGSVQLGAAVAATVLFKAEVSRRAPASAQGTGE